MNNRRANREEKLGTVQAHRRLSPSNAEESVVRLRIVHVSSEEKHCPLHASQAVGASQGTNSATPGDVLETVPTHVPNISIAEKT